MFWIVRQLLLLRRAVCARDTARQMAAGLACGLVLGLMPKGNLLAVLVAAILLSTRMSVPVGMFSAVVFTVIAPWCDPLTHRLGEAVLTHPLLSPVWRQLYQLPLAAWTGFNNTVVMGSLVLGAVLFYPAYRLALPWTNRLRRNSLAAPTGSAAGWKSTAECDRQPTVSPTVPASRTDGVAEPRILPRRVVPATRREPA